MYKHQSEHRCLAYKYTKSVFLLGQVVVLVLLMISCYCCCLVYIITHGQQQ